jgi:hypothetical protein
LGPIYTSVQTEIVLTTADVSRKGRVYYRLFYVESEAIGFSCGRSWVGSCNLARESSVLDYGLVWCPPLGVAGVRTFPSHSTVFLLVPGITPKLERAAHKEGNHLTMVKGIGDATYLQI